MHCEERLRWWTSLPQSQFRRVYAQIPAMSYLLTVTRRQPAMPPTWAGQITDLSRMIFYTTGFPAGAPVRGGKWGLLPPADAVDC